MLHLPAFTLRRVNHVLLVLILVVDGTIIGAPFLPGLLPGSLHPNAAHTTELKQKINHATPQQAPQPNQLIMPDIQLDQTVNEGQDTYAELAKGVWRWPGGSTPDKGSNTVMLGHRFTYSQPQGVFYFLDRVNIGDEIGVIWNNVAYTYKVSAITVVSPDHVEILQPTTDSRLTIYTCTPTWWPKDRLVITAEQEAPI